MPLVVFSLTLSNAEGYEGLEEEQELTVEMEIPDGFSKDELKQVINEMGAELPYFQYHNVIVEVNEVQIQEKHVRFFKVDGDNIGKEQRKNIFRAYEKIEADIMMARTKTPPGITVQEKTRLEKALDGIKNVFSKAKETVSGWFDGFQERKKQWEEARQREKEQLRIEKEQLQKQRLKELEAERKLLDSERLLEKEKTARMKIEERLEKTKLARLEKETKLAEVQKLREEKKELLSEKKELETKLSALDAKLEKTYSLLESLSAKVNPQQQYFGR